MDEGVDLQGKKDEEQKGTNLRFLELLDLLLTSYSNKELGDFIYS